MRDTQSQCEDIHLRDHDMAPQKGVILEVNSCVAACLAAVAICPLTSKAQGYLSPLDTSGICIKKKEKGKGHFIPAPPKTVKEVMQLIQCIKCFIEHCCLLACLGPYAQNPETQKYW